MWQPSFFFITCRISPLKGIRQTHYSLKKIFEDITSRKFSSLRSVLRSSLSSEIDKPAKNQTDKTRILERVRVPLIFNEIFAQNCLRFESISACASEIKCTVHLPFMSSLPYGTDYLCSYHSSLIKLTF